MRIKVNVGGRADHAVLEDDEYLSLQDGATIRTVYRKLKIPLHLWPFYKSFLNYRPAKMSDTLNDGDEVFFMTLAAGG